jgi:hypothetical protein
VFRSWAKNTTVDTLLGERGTGRGGGKKVKKKEKLNKKEIQE